MEHLKKCKPSEWWKEVKKLGGRSLASTAQSDTLKSLQHLHEDTDQICLANIINEAFLLPMHCFTPLPAAFPSTTFIKLPCCVGWVSPLETIKVEPVQSQRSRQHPRMVVKGTLFSWSGIWHLELLVPWRTHAIVMEARICSPRAEAKAHPWSK